MIVTLSKGLTAVSESSPGLSVPGHRTEPQRSHPVTQSPSNSSVRLCAVFQLIISFVPCFRIKPAPYTTGSSHVPASNSSSSFHSSPEELAYEGPSTSSAHLAPVASSSVSYDPRKPAVKKIAPMMAKTIKAFKNRFSRR